MLVGSLTDDFLVDEEFLETPIFVHLFHDIASAHELAFDIDLRYRRPVTIVFDLLSELLVSKHVHVLERHFVCSEQHRDILAEATLWHLFGPLHEDTNIILLNRSSDVLDHRVRTLTL